MSHMDAFDSGVIEKALTVAIEGTRKRPNIKANRNIARQKN